MADLIHTPEFRLSFPVLFEPKLPYNPKPGQKPRWSCAMLFKKGEDLADIKKAVAALLNEKFGNKANWPKGLRFPFNNQGDKEYEGYEDGAIVINAWRDDHQPGIVDSNVKRIIDQSEIYAGCYCIATVNPFYYDVSVNKGVAFGLRNIQKLRDGAPLGGYSRAEDDFEPLTSEDAGDELADDDIPF